jgi:hypothetical protein
MRDCLQPKPRPPADFGQIQRQSENWRLPIRCMRDQGISRLQDSTSTPQPRRLQGLWSTVNTISLLKSVEY